MDVVIVLGLVMQSTATIPMVRPAFDARVTAGEATFVDAPEETIGSSC